MNTATEAKVDSDSERSSIDRRRGMKLVGPAPKPTKKKPISITLSSEIFSSPAPNRKLALGRRPAAEGASFEGASDLSRNLRYEKREPDSPLTLGTFAAGIVILGAIALGYFVGRNRD